MNLISVTLLVLVLLINNVLCLKLLLVFPVPSKSHYILGAELAKGLANKGHQVTLVSPFSEPNPTKNLTYLVLAEIARIKGNIEKEMSADLFSRGADSKLGYIHEMLLLNEIGKVASETVLNSTEMRTLLKSNETFDAIILEQFMTEAFRGLVHHYNIPQIVFSSIGPHRAINRLVANPQPISYIPDIYTTNDMSIFERLLNFLLAIFSELFTYFIIYPTQNNILKKYFPSAPHLDDILYNASLVLTNSHESFNPAVPIVPNMIAIGGFHVNPPKELPKDIKQFMDSSKEGVIYFSLGSNLAPSQMPSHIKQTILKAFSTRKEKILWKWDEDILEGKPDNVKISKWLPQQSILAHSNCKLFITHGGLLSVMETINIGVPVLALPIFAEQKLNALRLSSIGVGKSLQFLQLTTEAINEALDELLYNPKYTENVKLRSKLLKDRPVQPMDLANYWIEYVVRYQGAPHLRVAGVDLPLYQYLCLDVIGLLVVINSLIFYLLWKLCTCRKSKSKSKKD